MKILFIDKQSNSFEVIPQNIDDLWYLDKILEKGDKIFGSTLRKFKVEGEKGEKSEKKRVYLEIELEEAQFHKFSNQLRMKGVIVTGKPIEYIDVGSYHTINLEPNDKIKIKKQALKQFQIERLKKAEKAVMKPKLVVCVLDDEAADIAMMREIGIDHKAKILSGKKGKQYDGEDFRQKFFTEVINKLEETDFEKLLVAGPGFTKDELKKFIDEKKKLKNKQIFYEPINSTGKTGINEILKKGLLDRVVEEMQLSKETQIVEDIFAHLGKDDNLATYGTKEVQFAVDSRAVAILLVSDKFMMANRDLVDELFKKADRQKAYVHIVSTEHEAGQKLEAISGIAALLRYPLFG